MPSGNQSGQPRKGIHPDAAGHKHSSRRFYLLLVLVGGCLLAALLYWNRPPEDRSRAADPISEPTTSHGQLDPAPPPLSPGRALAEVDEDSPIVQSAAVEPAATPLMRIEPSNFWKADRVTLGAHLKDADLAVFAKALDTVNSADERAALEAFQDVFRDPTSPGRAQALHLLLGYQKLEEKTLRTIFQEALEDPDTTIGRAAVGTLVGRQDELAIATLSSAYNEGDTSTRLLIVESLATDSAAVAILHAALGDPEEMVRISATTILSPASDEALQVSPQALQQDTSR